jgi:hypothetical protein
MSPGQDVKLPIAWKLADHLFKFVQWLFFLALLLYAAQRSRSRILGAICTVLFLALFFVVFKALGSFFYIEVDDTRPILTKIPAALVAAVISVILTGVALYVVGAVVEDIVRSTHL